MSRHSSDVLYLVLRPGLLLKMEFSPAERRVVFRFGQLSPSETAAVAVDLLDLDRLVQLFNSAQTDARTHGYLADSIMGTVTKPGGTGLASGPR